jgi:hydrogenase maturation protease
MTRTLVAGIGNVFFGDDAFGCEVARQLGRLALPRGVSVRDFGIRGVDLAYALLDDCDAAILIDAVQRGGAPGSLYVIEPTLAAPEPSARAWDGHGLTPDQVLRMVCALGGTPPALRVVGCEPAELGSELEPKGELSSVVAARVPEAVQLVLRLLDEFCAPRGAEGRPHA